MSRERQLFGSTFQEYISQSQLRSRVAEMGRAISQHYGSKEVQVLIMLKGAILFGSDLVREMSCPLKVHFVQYQSYQGTQSSELKEILPLPTGLDGKQVLVVEDILDTGKTLSYLTEQLAEKGCESVETAILLNKTEAHRGHIKPTWQGFEIPNAFVVGYGLDFDGYGREWQSIFAQQ